jgi:hypothetical protein
MTASSRGHDGLHDRLSTAHGDEPAANAEDVERWRHVVADRVRHHDVVFHRAIQETQDAVDLLDVLVGSVRGRGGDDAGDVAAGLSQVAADGDDAAKAMQLRQLRAVGDSLQLAVDILRARQQLASERRGQDKTSAPLSPRRPAGTHFVWPWNSSAHGDTEAHALKAAQWVSKRVLEQDLATTAERRGAELSTSAAEVSQSTRALAAECERLETVKLELDAAVRTHEAELHRLRATPRSGIHLPSVESGLYLPRDSKVWSAWARELQAVGRPGTIAGAAADASPRNSATPRRSGSIFDYDADALASKIAALPEVAAWAQLAGTLYNDALKNIARAAGV